MYSSGRFSTSLQKNSAGFDDFMKGRPVRRRRHGGIMPPETVRLLFSPHFDKTSIFLTIFRNYVL